MVGLVALLQVLAVQLRPRLHAQVVEHARLQEGGDQLPYLVRQPEDSLQQGYTVRVWTGDLLGEWVQVARPKAANKRHEAAHRSIHAYGTG